MKNLSSNATLQEVKDRHKVRMGIKENLRAERYTSANKKPFVFANVSKHHPNYGETPAEQAERMQK